MNSAFRTKIKPEKALSFVYLMKKLLNGTIFCCLRQVLREHVQRAKRFCSWKIFEFQVWAMVYKDFVILIKVLWYQANCFKYWLIIIGDIVSGWPLSSSFSFCNTVQLNSAANLATTHFTWVFSLPHNRGGRSWVVRYYLNCVLTNEVNFVLFALSWTPVMSLTLLVSA